MSQHVAVLAVSDSEDGQRDQEEHDVVYAQGDPIPLENQLRQLQSDSEQPNEVSSNSQQGQVEDLCQSSDERVLQGETSRRPVISTLNQRKSSAPPIVSIISGEDSVEMTKPVKRGWGKSSHNRGSRTSPVTEAALEVIQEESTVEITMEQSKSRTNLQSSAAQQHSLSSLGAKRTERIEDSFADDGLEELTAANRGKPWRAETLVIDEDSRQAKSGKPGPGKIVGTNGRLSQGTSGRPGALDLLEDSDPKVSDVKQDGGIIPLISEESVRNPNFDDARLSKLYDILYVFCFEPLRVLSLDQKATSQGYRTVKGESEADDPKLDEYSNNPTFGTDEYKPEQSLPCKIIEDPKEIAKMRHKGLDKKLFKNLADELRKYGKLKERIEQLKLELKYTENPHLRPPPPQPVQPVVSPPKFEEPAPVEGKVSSPKSEAEIKQQLLQSTDSEEDRPIEGLDDIYDFDQHLLRRKKESRIKKPRPPQEHYSPKRAELEWVHKLIQEQLGPTDFKIMTNEEYLKLKKGSSRKKRSSRSNSTRRRSERFLRTSKSRSKSKSKSRSRSRRRLKELERKHSRASSAKRSRSRGSHTRQQPIIGYPPQFYPRHYKDIRFRPGEMIRTADGRILVPKRYPDKHSNYGYPGYSVPGPSSAYLRMREGERKRSRSRSNPKYDYTPQHLLPVGRAHRSGQKMPFMPDYDHDYYYPPYLYDMPGEMVPLGKRWPKTHPVFAENERFAVPDGFHPVEKKSRKSSTSRKSKSRSLRKDQPNYSTEDELIERLRAQTSQLNNFIPPKEEPAKEEEELSVPQQHNAPKPKPLPELERLLRDRKPTDHRSALAEEYFARDSSPGDEMDHQESAHRMLISPTTQRKLRQISMESSFSSAGPVRAVKRASAVSTSNSALASLHAHEPLREDQDFDFQVQLSKDQTQNDRVPSTSSHVGFGRSPLAGAPVQAADQSDRALMDHEIGGMDSHIASFAENKKRSKKSSTPGPNLWTIKSKDPNSSPDLSAISKHLQTAANKKNMVRAGGK